MRPTSLPLSSMAKILLVDDSAIEFAILRRILGDATLWELEWARSGLEGLERLRRDPSTVDLVILDLVMPGMDGFQVLEAMGADPLLSHLPVIVLTSSSDRSDQVRALTSGAEEYLLKPLEPDIARVRVRSVLELARHRFDLERLARERAAQLAHSDRLVSLGQLAAGMAHEINNPLAWISGSLQTLERFAPVLREELSRIPGWTPSDRLQRLLDEFPAIAEDMKGGVRRVSRIVDGLKTYSRSGSGSRARVDLAEVVHDAQVLCGHMLKGIDVDLQVPPEPVRVVVVAQEIEQVVVNLLANAAYAVGEASHPEGDPARIAICVCGREGRACLSVRDNGPGIPEAILSRLGTPFLTTKPPGKGTGLGLSISQGIARAHGGELRAMPCDSGAFFLLELPLAPAPNEDSA